MTLAKARVILRECGMVVSKRGGEYRVAYSAEHWVLTRKAIDRLAVRRDSLETAVLAGLEMGIPVIPPTGQLQRRWAEDGARRMRRLKMKCAVLRRQIRRERP